MLDTANFFAARKGLPEKFARSETQMRMLNLAAVWECQRDVNYVYKNSSKSIASESPGSKRTWVVALKSGVCALPGI